MEFLEWIYRVLIRATGGLFGTVTDLGEAVLARWGEELGLGKTLVCLIAIGLCLFVGLTAYKLIKLYIPLLLGTLGFFLGHHMFFQIALLDKAPDFCAYLLGGAVAVVMILLSFRRVTYAWFGGITLLGYCVFRFWIIDDFWSAILLAVLFAFVTMYAIRIFFVIISSLGCATLLTGLTFFLLPAVELFGRNIFELSAKNPIYWVAFGLLSLIFIAVQFALCRKKQVEND